MTGLPGAGRTIAQAVELQEREGERRERKPGEPVAQQKKYGGVVRRGDLDYQVGERRGVAPGLREDAAAVVTHGEVAVAGSSRDAEAIFHAAHHGDVPMPPAVQPEIPGRHQHQSHARLSIAAGERCEIHVLADCYAPGPGVLGQEGESRARSQAGFKRRQKMVFVVGQHRSPGRIDAGLVVLHSPGNANLTHDDGGAGLIGQTLEEAVRTFEIGIHDDPHLFRKHDHAGSTGGEFFRFEGVVAQQSRRRSAFARDRSVGRLIGCDESHRYRGAGMRHCHANGAESQH